MIENILIREVEKDIVKFDYSDVIFFGNDDIYHNTIEILKTYKNHFSNLTLQSINTLNSDLIFQSISKGILPIIIGDFNYDSIKYYYTTTISNNVRGLSDNSNYMGFQRHLCSLSDLSIIDNNIQESFSLGKIYNNILNTEPTLRETEVLIVDLSVLSSTIIKTRNNSSVTGMSIETLIQLVNYTSHSPELKLVQFNTNSVESNKEGAAELIALCLWYFIEGLNYGKYKSEESDSSFFITIAELEHAINFLHSSKFDKWWVKFEGDDKAIPCSYEDYLKANEGEISDRLLRKLSSD
jgi:hypothetical protein